MTNKITLNNESFTFNKSFLPCLITGACKSGASYFSVSLIAQLIQQGTKVIFFTAFPMAKEELLYQIGNDKTFEIINESNIENIPQNKSIIIQSGNKEVWQKTIQRIYNKEEYIIFIKNIEEYDKSILETIGEQKNIILSGSIDDCNFKEDVIKKTRESEIIFTVPKNNLSMTIPTLEKYESYLINRHGKGVLRLIK